MFTNRIHKKNVVLNYNNIFTFTYVLLYIVNYA